MICTTLLIGEELLETKVLKKCKLWYLNSWCTGKNNIVLSCITQLLNGRSQKRLEIMQEKRLEQSLASVRLNYQRNNGMLTLRLLHFLSITKALRAQ